MKRYLALLILAAVVGVGAPAVAHHSFAATYFEDRSVTIDGELVQFVYRHPHSFVYVMVTDKQNAMTRYMVEWVSANQLEHHGVGRETLKVGERLVISGAPGRNPDDHRVRLVTLRRPKDGFGWANGQTVN